MLNNGVNDALADPEMKKKFADLGGMMLGGIAFGIRQIPRRRNRQMGPKVIHDADLKLME